MTEYFEITTFQDEYEALQRLISNKRYHRCGDKLCTLKDGAMVPEYNLCEFVWGFCKNPCFAKRLIETLETKLRDHKPIYRLISRSNKKVSAQKLFPKWEQALAVAQEAESHIETSRPMIVYSTETSSMISSKTIYCDQVDGEFWHGVLLADDVLSNLESIKMKIVHTGEENNFQTNKPPQTVASYEWNNRKIRKSSTLLNQPTSMFYFSPFKNPILMFNNPIELQISFNFIDGRLPNESTIKMVYGICNMQLEQWLEKFGFSVPMRLCDDKTLVILQNGNFKFF